MAKKKAPATGKQMTNWNEELAKMAQVSAGIEASVGLGGNYIKTRGGQLEYNGGIIPDNKMNVIILDHVLENAFYQGRFDPENPQPPVCFAIGRDSKTMEPHENSSDRQSDACEGCPMNEFGSADTGRGKACKNTRRLALLPEDALENVEDADVAFIKVPVTSVKAWAGYVRQLADTLKRPTLGVITQISLTPDPKTQFKMNFKLMGTIDDGDVIGELIAKRQSAEAVLTAPYSPPEDDAQPAKRPARGAQRPARSKVAARSRR
jgi:hypothetical protein